MPPHLFSFYDMIIFFCVIRIFKLKIGRTKDWFNKSLLQASDTILNMFSLFETQTIENGIILYGIWISS